MPGAAAAAPRDPTPQAPHERSAARQVTKVAGPLLVGAASTLLLALADAAILGHYDTRAQAAMAQAAVVYVALSAVISPLVGNLQIVVAQRYGAADKASVRASLTLGVRLAAAVGVVVACVAVALATQLVDWTSLSDEVAQQPTVVLTLRLLLLGLPISLVGTAGRSWMSAQGHTKVAMNSTIIANIANIALDLVLVFGLRLGAPGSALGTTLGASLGAGYAVWAGYRHRRRHLPEKDQHAAHAGLLPRVWAVAWPDMVFGAASYGADLMIMVSVTTLGTATLAAYRVTGSTMALLFTFAYTCSTAITILTAQEIGASRGARARRITRAGTLVTAGFVGLAAAPVLLTPGWYALLFTSDQQVMEPLVHALRVFWVIAPAMVAAMSLAGLVRGAGDTRSMMLVGLVAQCVVAVPAAWLLGVHLGFGLTGVVGGMALGWVTRIILTAWRASRLTLHGEATDAQEQVAAP